MSSGHTATPTGKACGEPGGTDHHHRIDTPGGGQPLRCPPPGIVMLTMRRVDAHVGVWAYPETRRVETQRRVPCGQYCSRNLPDLGCDPKSAGAPMVNGHHASPHRFRGAHACHRFPCYRVRCFRDRAALRVNAPSRLTARAHHAKRGCRLLLRCEEGGGFFS